MAAESIVQPGKILISVVKSPAVGVLLFEHFGEAAESFRAQQGVFAAVVEEAIPLVGEIPGNDAWAIR